MTYCDELDRQVQRKYGRNHFAEPCGNYVTIYREDHNGTAIRVNRFPVDDGIIDWTCPQGF